MKIVSFNIRYKWDGDGQNSLKYRMSMILETIRAEKPDLIGFQEVFARTAEFLEASLPEYNVLFMGRAVDMKGEGMAIAARKETLAVKTVERFWLSPTPRVPGSRYQEQSSCPRICQCVMLQKKPDGDFFRFYNTHLDHRGEQARMLGIHQIGERMKSDYDEMPMPYVLVGDFNTYPGSPVLNYCLQESPAPMVEVSEGIGQTFHNFGQPGLDVGEQIDFILTDPATAAAKKAVGKWTKEEDGVYLSDHYPVWAEFDL